MTPPELLVLAERVEAASGPDRELDAVIFHALGMPLPQEFAGHPIALDYDELERSFNVPVGGMRVRYEQPAYTASLDAAMSLVAKGFGFAVGDWFCEGVPGGPTFAECYDIEHIRATDGESKIHVQVYAKTHALALTVAALRALAHAAEGSGG